MSAPNAAVPLVAKDTIAALVRCEIRHTVEAADASGVTVRFDIDAFDRLGEELYLRLEEFDIDQCEGGGG